MGTLKRIGAADQSRTSGGRLRRIDTGEIITYNPDPIRSRPIVDKTAAGGNTGAGVSSIAGLKALRDAGGGTVSGGRAGAFGVLPAIQQATESTSGEIARLRSQSAQLVNRAAEVMEVDPEAYDRYAEQGRQIQARIGELKTERYEEARRSQIDRLSRVTQEADFRTTADAARAEMPNLDTNKPKYDAVKQAMFYITTGKDGGGDAPYYLMTEEQKDILSYYVGRGELDHAADYLDAIVRDLNRQAAEQTKQSVSAWAEEHPVQGALVNMTTGLLTAPALLENAGQMLRNRVTGEYEPTDVNSTAFGAVHIQNSAAEGTQQAAYQAAKETFGSEMAGNTAAFLAGTGMSIGQNVTQIAATGPLSLAAMSVNAAASSTTDALEKGATPGQAFLVGTASGVVEAVTEKIPLDNLFRLAREGSGGHAVREVLRQMFTEATEESISEMANNVIQTAVLGEQSDYRQYVAALQAQGLSAAEAEKEAFVQFYVYNVLQAAAGGALSGGVMGGGAMGVNAASNYLYDAQTGKRAALEGQQYALIETALEQYAPESKSHQLAVKLSRALSSSEETTMSNGQLGRLDRLMQEEYRSAGPQSAQGRQETAQVLHPEAEVITPTAKALLDAGETTREAVRKAQVLDRLLEGDASVTDSQLRRLGLRDPITQQVFTQLTGIQVPQTTDTRALLETSRSAAEAVQDVRAKQAILGRTAEGQLQAARTVQAAADQARRVNIGDIFRPAGQNNTASTGEAGNRGESVGVIQNLRNHIPSFAGIQPVFAVSSQEIRTTDGHTMAEKARTLFEKIKGVVTRQGFGDIEINARSVKDDLSHGVGPAKATVIPAIPSVIQNGVQIDYQQNWKGRPYDGYVFAAPVTLDGTTVYVAAVVKRTSKNRFYLHEVVDSNGNIIKIDSEERANPTGLAADGDAGAQSSLSTASIIRQEAQEVKAQDARTGQNISIGEVFRPAQAQARETRTEGRGLVQDDYTAALGPALRQEIDGVARMLGVQVRFVDAGQIGGGAANAAIRGNEIRIERDNQHPVRTLLGHELTHRVQDLAPNEYGAFRAAALAELGDAAAQAEGLQALYRQRGLELSREAALDELAADYAGGLIEDRDLLARFIERNRTDRSLLQRLRDAVRSLVEKLTGRWKDRAGRAQTMLEEAVQAAARTQELQPDGSRATMETLRYSLKEDGIDGEQGQTDGGRERDRDEVSETSGTLSRLRETDTGESGSRETLGGGVSQNAPGEIEPRAGSGAEVVRRDAAEYGIPSHTMTEEALRAQGHPNGFSSAGEIYTPENLPVELAGNFSRHELTHTMKQLDFYAYRTFVMGVEDQLVLSPKVDAVLEGLMRHRKLSGVYQELSLDDKFDVLDEFCAVTIGAYTQDPVSFVQTFGDMYQDVEGFVSELSDILEQFKGRETTGDSRTQFSLKGSQEMQQAVKELMERADREAGWTEAEFRREVDQIARRVYGEQAAQARAEAKAREKQASGRRSAAELRRRVTKHAGELSRTLLKGTDSRHVPEDLRRTAAALLEAINLESAYTVDPESGARTKNGGGDPTKRTELARALKEQYQAILNEADHELVVDPNLLGGEGAAGDFDAVIRMSNVRVADMSGEQLETVWRVVRAVEKSIATAGKTLTAAKYESTRQWANALAADTVSRKNKGTLTKEHASLDLETPLTFFSHYGEAGQQIYRMLREAQDKQTTLLEQVRQAVAKTADLKQMKAWEKEVHTFQAAGGTLTLTTAQLMDLYLLSKRAQAQKHLYLGGVVQPEIPSERIRAGTDAVQVTPEDVAAMLDTLTQEQKQTADGLQQLTAGLLAEMGNEATQAAYGYKKFRGRDYWPITAARSGIRQDVEQGGGQPRSIQNIGLAKSTVPNAANAMTLGSIADVFSRHAADMTDYAAWLLPMEDAGRLFNYTFKDGKGHRTTRTVKGLLNDKGGPRADQYWLNLMRDIQNGTGGEADSALVSQVERMAGRAKGAAVGGNLRVVIQQPTAYLRAAAVLSPTAMTRGLTGGATGGNGWKKALKYAPIATRKLWGGFEIANSPRQTAGLLFEKQSGLDRFNERLAAGAAWADQVTWGRLWNACEWQTAQRSGKPEGDTAAFYAKVAELFTRVVDETQVVDGVLQRSQIMRSSSGVARQLTAFMGEPTMSLNLMLRAWDQYQNETDPTKRGRAKTAVARAAAALIVTGLVNALAQSLVDALRDDDEDKAYWGRFWEAFTGLDGAEESAWDKAVGIALSGNAVGNLNPLGMLPVAKDLLSLVQGYSVERMDVSALGDLIQAVQLLLGDKRTPVYAVQHVASAGAKLFGVAAGNVLRDVWGAVHSIAVDTKNIPLQYALTRAVYRLTSERNRGRYMDLLYRALELGDTESYRRITADLLNSGAVTAAYLDNAMRSRYASALKEDAGYTLPQGSMDLIGSGEQAASAPREDGFGVDDLDAAGYEDFTQRRADAYRALADVLGGDAAEGALELAYDYADELALRDVSGGRYEDVPKWMTALERTSGSTAETAAYLELRARSRTEDATVTELALTADLNDRTAATALLVETSFPDSFTDPGKSGYEYRLGEDQKARYRSLYEDAFRAGFTELAGEDDWQEGDLAQRKELLSGLKRDVGEKVRKELAAWLQERGVKSVEKG